MSNKVMAWTMPSDKTKIQMEEAEEAHVNQMAERNTSLLFLISDWAENTSWGGVPYIVKNKSYIWKALWAMLVCAGLGITSYQVWQVFDRFFQYPVNINVNVTYTNKIQFPAVTLCNVNTMRASGFAEIPPEYYPLFETFFGNSTSSSNTERQRVQELFQQVYNTMDYPTRMAIAHQRDDMIIDCIFNGVKCNNSDFVPWNDAVLGNCFTFNSGYIVDTTTGSFRKNDLLHTYRTGPNYGLSVEIYIQQEDYVKELTEMAGIKVVIHNQGVHAFPADRGIYMAPTTYNSLTLQKTNITRLPTPYPSNCITVTDASEAIKVDAFVEVFGMDYDISGCVKSCYQSYVIAECDCGDPKLPINTIATRVRASNTSAIYPTCATLESLECQHNISTLFADNKLDCSECRTACSDITYSHTLSSATWPNQQLLETKLAQISASHPKYASYIASSSSPEANLLKFNVHFEELNYEVIYESPAYKVESIYGDIGGVIGLWLGLSFIAVFELIQLAIDSAVMSCYVIGNKANKKKTPVEMQTRE